MSSFEFQLIIIFGKLQNGSAAVSPRRFANLMFGPSNQIALGGKRPDTLHDVVTPAAGLLAAGHHDVALVLATSILPLMRSRMAHLFGRLKVRAFHERRSCSLCRN